MNLNQVFSVVRLIVSNNNVILASIQNHENAIFVALCHSFWNFYYFFNIHSYNTITLRSSFIIRRGPSSWFLIASSLSKWSLHGMPSRDSNSGLPYSKPTHYQLSCAASLCVLGFHIILCLIKAASDHENNFRMTPWQLAHPFSGFHPV